MSTNATIGYRPSDESLKFLNEFCDKQSALSRPQLIEVALRFLMQWPKEDILNIIGRAHSAKEMKDYLTKLKKNQK
ncbi:MAG: hypothetical protein KDK66_02410 [Deltaproteobacteria bacterium]|nr:hypothetical protein [Deltaproteobacteria bacterium]